MPRQRITVKPPPTRPGVEQMLSSTELRQRLGISTATLLRMRRSGRLPVGYLIGDQWRYRPSDIEAWLEQQRPGGAA